MPVVFSWLGKITEIVQQRETALVSNQKGNSFTG